MSKAVDLSAIVTAISIAASAVAVVLYFTDDQARQDHDHINEREAAAIQAEIIDAKKDAAIADENRIQWRLSEYRKAERTGTLSEGGRERMEQLELDRYALAEKRDALRRERELYRKKAEGVE